MDTYTYILAPHTAHNYAVLQQAVNEFPNLLGNNQIGSAYLKNINDMVDIDGVLKVPVSSDIYIYVKADTDELNESGLLAFVQDAQTFNIDNQPKSTFWLNVQ